MGFIFGPSEESPCSGARGFFFGQGLRMVLELLKSLTIILLDEPTAHLDINYPIEILDLIRNLCLEQGLVTIVALHDLNLATQYCDRLFLLHEGGIYREGVPKEVIDTRGAGGVEGEVRLMPCGKCPDYSYSSGH